MSGVLTQAVLPTARVVGWGPGAAVAGLLVLSAWLAGVTDRAADVVLVLAAAGLAATVLAGMQDPAAELLAAVPVSTMRRRLLRVVLLGVPALTVWWLLGVLTTTARTAGPGPLLALTACGVAVAVWTPPRHGALLGAVTPVVLVALRQVVPLDGTVSEVVGWWLTDPWWVLAAASLLCLAGRRR